MNLHKYLSEFSIPYTVFLISETIDLMKDQSLFKALIAVNTFHGLVSSSKQYVHRQGTCCISQLLYPRCDICDHQLSLDLILPRCHCQHLKRTFFLNTVDEKGKQRLNC